MTIQEAIRALTERRDLSAEQMRLVMQAIMTGGCTPAQVGGFLIGLRMKGETVDEVTAAAEIMRSLALRVDVSGPHLIDIVGTGGDVSGTFNVSTASAFVAAAAGAQVAKHGNRSVSSQSGSADLLEAAGININLNPAQIATCIRQLNLGFMFAPLHHSAMKHAIGPRREMAVRTIFNLLGPLTNPAFVTRQLVGVFALEWLQPVAEALQRLGAQQAMVVHADDGMDEISIASATQVAELKDGSIRRYQLCPEDFGLARASRQAISVDSAQASLAMIRAALNNQPGPALDTVLLNAGASIYIAGLVDSHAAGIARAREVIASGAAAEKITQLAQLSQKLTQQAEASA